jgi:hypothetical protein
MINMRMCLESSMVHSKVPVNIKKLNKYSYLLKKLTNSVLYSLDEFYLTNYVTCRSKTAMISHITILHYALVLYIIILYCILFVLML